MDENAWKRLRRSLLIFAPVGFVLSYMALELATKGMNHMLGGDVSNGSGAFMKDLDCRSVAQVKLLVYPDLTPSDGVLVAVMIAAFVLTCLWLRWAPTPGLRFAALAIMSLTAIAIVWLGVDAYINLRGGLVWFSPRCPGAS